MAALDRGDDFHAARVYGVGEVVVYVHGEADFAPAPRLLRALQSALESDRTVIIDLGGMTFIDSQGIRVLIEAYKATQPNGAERLVLRSPRSQARKVLELTRLDTLLRIED
jgi:anti-anti-sigma factor